jgi:hypothetical protein
MVFVLFFFYSQVNRSKIEVICIYIKKVYLLDLNLGLLTGDDFILTKGFEELFLVMNRNIS